MQNVVENMLSLVLKLIYLLDSMLEKLAFATACKTWFYKRRTLVQVASDVGPASCAGVLLCRQRRTRPMCDTGRGP
jgi:hypothetical protein